MAQEKVSRATKEMEESVEACALRLRGFLEFCCNSYFVGVIKQPHIQSLYEFIRTDAFIYKKPTCSYQQLVTYTAGKFKAAKDVIELANVDLKAEDVGRKEVIILRTLAPWPRLPLIAVANPPASSGTPWPIPTMKMTYEAAKPASWSARRTGSGGPSIVIFGRRRTFWPTSGPSCLLSRVKGFSRPMARF